MRPNTFLAGLRPAIWTNLFMTLTVCSALLATPCGLAQTFDVLHAFTSAPGGEDPAAGVTLDPSGNIYGTTFDGGRHFEGTMFRLSPDGHETVLYSFLGIYGEGPASALFRDARGALYGTTQGGGRNNRGAVYRLDAKGNEKVLYSFPEDGGAPYSAVIRDADGNLYGNASGDGTGSCGSVFKVSPAGKETTLYTFTGGTDGCVPTGSLVRDSAGDLYGSAWAGGDLNCLAPYGCGVVFKLDTAGNETVLYTFTGANDGARPVGVVRDDEGNFYGATTYGGGICGEQLGCGTVFKVDSAGHETVLYRFTGVAGDGTQPYGVVLDAAGNIYGSAGGGDNYDGVVFKLDTRGKETILHSFTGGADGAGPSEVVLDSAGNIYGTTPTGGDLSCVFRNPPGCGTVFKISP